MYDLVQSRLPQLHAKSVVDLENIESVFSLIEMGDLIQKLPGTTSEEISLATRAIRRVLSETIELRCRFPTKDGYRIPHPEYRALVEHVESSRAANAFITFNYDLALDFALHWSDVRFDYTLDEKRSLNFLPLLKLHGSLNWTACEGCGSIISAPFEKIAVASPRASSGVVQT